MNTIDTVTAARIARLPTWGAIAIPYMTYFHDGKPDFKVLDQAHVLDCAQHGLCGICGDNITDAFIFVGGPESTVYIDPPYHLGCVNYAFSVCPYLLGTRDYADQRTDYHADVIVGGEPEKLRGVTTMTLYYTRSYKVAVIEDVLVFMPGKSMMIQYRDRLTPPQATP